MVNLRCNPQDSPAASRQCNHLAIHHVDHPADQVLSHQFSLVVNQQVNHRTIPAVSLPCSLRNNLALNRLFNLLYSHRVVHPVDQMLSHQFSQVHNLVGVHLGNPVVNLHCSLPGNQLARHRINRQASLRGILRINLVRNQLVSHVHFLQVSQLLVRADNPPQCLRFSLRVSLPTIQVVDHLVHQPLFHRHSHPVGPAWCLHVNPVVVLQVNHSRYRHLNRRCNLQLSQHHGLLPYQALCPHRCQAAVQHDSRVLYPRCVLQ